MGIPIARRSSLLERFCGAGGAVQVGKVARKNVQLQMIQILRYSMVLHGITIVSHTPARPLSFFLETPVPSSTRTVHQGRGVPSSSTRSSCV